MTTARETVRSKIIASIAFRLANDRRGNDLASFRAAAPAALAWLRQCHSEVDAFAAALDDQRMNTLLDDLASAALAKHGDMEVYRAATVAIWDDAGYPAYIDGREWNGWDMPLFELATAFRVLNDFSAAAMGDDVESAVSYTYNPATGVFMVTEHAADDEPYECAPQHFVDDSGVPRVGYEIGNGWVWYDKARD